MHTINKGRNRFFKVVINKNLFAILLLLGSFLVPRSSYAQGIKSDDSFTFELGLPNSFVNEPFKDIMQGLVTVSPSYQYAFENHIALGIGAHYSYFAVNEFNVPSAIYGGMHCLGGYLKVGHEKFWGERFGTDMGLRVGYVHTMIKTDALFAEGIRLNVIPSFYIEPNIGLILSADDSNSYRLTIGYPFYGFGFQPQLIGVIDDAGYDPQDYEKTSSFLVIGFGYTHYFNGKTNE